MRKWHGGDWYLLLNSLMRASVIEVHLVCFEERVELLFMKDEEVIQTFSSHAPRDARSHTAFARRESGTAFEGL